MEKEIEILNKNKVAYLYSKDLYETEVRKITRHGYEQFAFVYIKTEEVAKCLKEYDNNAELKRFLTNFNTINSIIRKLKTY